jgi:citrate synthase
MSPSKLASRASLPSADYVACREALAILDVKPQTLYSYVSRGLVRRISPNGRSSFYSRADIQRLRARSEARSGHGAVAGSALHWGEPVLVTGITEITVQGPRYRRHLALHLVRDGYSLEAVAEYLWTAIEPSKSVNWRMDKSVARIASQLGKLVEHYPNLHIRQLLMEAVLLHSMGGGLDHGDQAEPPPIATARALIQALGGAMGFIGPHRIFMRQASGESIACVLARAFGVEPSERQVRAINAACVLLADHEFTPGTFTARIASSAGVDLHSCIGAALQVHFGSALGLRCDRIEQMLRQQLLRWIAPSDRQIDPSLVQAGFKHPLYVNGDPRAHKIVELALELDQHAQAARSALGRLRKIEDGGGNLTLDSALVVFCRALGIESPAAGALLAFSRAVGWIAHVIEQRQQDFMIRPRGKFVGVAAAADGCAA